jgi:nitroimidazol reductase NimA-like FMN-containing flavoprotein (pyridoxamine 5'-phosphate oxidase superfamily)
MGEPIADRPYMAGYGLAEGDSGMLPWGWAEERLIRSHDYWCATTWPDGRPHVMPVWAVWLDGGLWFSSAPRSRKAKNVERDPRCVLTTYDALEPVVLEGRAERVTERARIETFTAAANAKYETDYAVDFYVKNALYRVEPSWVFALTEERFDTSPTRWRFG